MPLPPVAFYSIYEIAVRWGCPPADVAGWAAAGLCLLPLPAMSQAPVVGPATCEAERAVYEMTAPDTEEVWRIGLVPARNMASIASDLYLKLTTPQRDYWFSRTITASGVRARASPCHLCGS